MSSSAAASSVGDGPPLPASSMQLARAASLEKRQQHLQRAASNSNRAATAGGSGGAGSPCPCLATARKWLSSPSTNPLHLRLLHERPDEWEIDCPSLATSSDRVTFAISLDLPHGICVSQEGSVLEELEADSYAVLFGDGEACEKQRQQFATADAVADPTAAASASSPHHDGCTVSAILAYAHAHIRKMDADWTSPTSGGAKSARRAAVAAAAAAALNGGDTEFDGAVGGSGGDGDDAADNGFGEEDDDEGFGDGGDDDNDAAGWGDAEEMDASAFGVDYDSTALPASAAASPSRYADSASAAASSAAASSSGAIATSSSSSAADNSGGSGGGVKVLSLAEVSELQANMIHRVSSSLDITSSAAIVLLRKSRWREDQCMARFKVEGIKWAQEANVAGLLREFIVPPPQQPSSADGGSSSGGGQTLFTCPVCYDDVPYEATFSMRCGHRHCIPCWQAYLTSEIEGGSLTGGSALDTRCAGFKCQEALGHECVELILAHNDGSAEQEATHARLLQRYEGMLARSFVDENDSLQWCPSPGCDRVLESHAKLNTVKCSCGCVFCFRCCLDAHAPCSCAEAADWNARDKGNSNLDTKFMMENTKACPNCHVRTKKEGGCMYIVCVCKTSWCWHCGQDGKDHHVWECNRPKYEASDKGSELSRYLFYFERFHNHRESTKVAAKQMAKTEAKMASLVAEGMHWKQVDFVKHATQLVLQCRRVLSWSYARAFFIKDKSTKQLFEYRQSELEEFTEKLNQMTEGSLEALTRDRLLVLDWTRALTRYLDNMQIDEVHTEKAIPAHAVTKKVTKEEAAAAGKIALSAPAAAAAATITNALADAASPAAADKPDSPAKDAPVVA